MIISALNLFREEKLVFGIYLYSLLCGNIYVII